MLNKKTLKKMKSKILSIGVGAAIAATSLQSCSNSDGILNVDLPKNEVVNPDVTAISMKNLSEYERNYIQDMGLLSQLILNETTAADSFYKDPVGYAQSLGLKTEINVDDGTVRFLLAICQPEFRDAIEKRDIRRFVTLCEDNDVFKNAVSSNVNLLKNSMTRVSRPDTDVSMGFWWIGEWILIGVAYAGVGLEYNAIGGPSGPVMAATNTINSETALQVWDAQTQDGSVYKLADEYNNLYIQDVVSLVKEKHPEVKEQYTDKELVELVQNALNL